MAQLLNLRPPLPTPIKKADTPTRRSSPTRQKLAASTASSTQSWTSLSHSLKCNGRFSCLFSDNRRQEQARKALESALGEKKSEYEKWDKEMKRREDSSGGGNSGGGGWFRWGGWSGGDGDRFWQEAQQASLTILGILVVYLIVAKGDVMLAVIFNPLLFALRGTRSAFTFLTSKIMSKIYPAGQNFDPPQEEVAVHVSAKESVVGKWGSS